jgi:peroxiredoxin
VPRLNVRIGQPAPNFLFELAPGRGMPLRKLAGRPVVLGFWRSSSRPSIESVLDLQKTANRGGVQQYIVLAINDGESPELARAVAAENGLSATLVTDPKQEISLAYGVSIWPSTVFLDASGVITGIRYGYLAGNVEPSSQGKATVSR